MDETNFKEKTTMRLIQKMVDSGLQVTEELAGEIMSREDSIPHLIRILKDDKLRDFAHQ